jgi:uncharacterized protein YkwD
MLELRVRIVTIALVVLACSSLAASAARAGTHAGAAPAAAQTLTAQPALERGVVAAINRFRRSRSLRPVTLSRTLSTAARVQTTSMGRLGFFAHESADGSVFWKRVQRSYGSAGYARWSVGENLLWSTNVDAAGALELWIASPHHLANLVDPTWREIGIAATRVSAAGGVYGGNDVTIITTDFGVRAR